jgi:hypothetical protein
MQTSRQPSQKGDTEVLNFRLPRHEDVALRQLAARRDVKLGRMLRENTAPLLALAIELADHGQRESS